MSTKEKKAKHTVKVDEATRHITKADLSKTVHAETKELKAAKTEKRRVQISAPPAPMVKVGDVVNPIIGNRGLKRALTIAIVNACTKDGKTDEMRAGLLIRASGVLWKSGYTEEVVTDKLASNEWSGKSYARFATTVEGKNYISKFPEKVEKCVAFAKALYDATKLETPAPAEPTKAPEPALEMVPAVPVEEVKPETALVSN